MGIEDWESLRGCWSNEIAQEKSGGGDGRRRRRRFSRKKIRKTYNVITMRQEEGKNGRC